MIRKVVAAIRYCHEHHVIHRDVKLENILWESEAEDAEPQVTARAATMVLSWSHPTQGSLHCLPGMFSLDAHVSASPQGTAGAINGPLRGVKRGVTAVELTTHPKDVDLLTLPCTATARCRKRHPCLANGPAAASNSDDACRYGLCVSQRFR